MKKRTKKEDLKERIYNECLEIIIDVAKQGHGGLIVIGDIKPEYYECHYPNLFRNRRISLFEKGIKPVLTKLVTLDGALIIDKKGIVKAYGARILKQLVEKGHGTRHAAARGISTTGATAILASEEDRVVRIFEDGHVLIEVNPFTKDVEKNKTKIVRILQSPDTAGLIAGAAAAPMMGIPILPGVIIFGGSYLVSKKILSMIKEIE